MRFLSKTSWMKAAVPAMALTAAGLLGLVWNSNAMAQGGLLSEASAHQAGLTVDWYSQVDVGPDGKVVDFDLTVDENNATTFFAIEYSGNREVITQNTLDSFGNPYGIDGAAKHIELRKEIIAAEYKKMGKDMPEIKTSKYSLPTSTVYAAVSDGTVYSIDADTGQTNWMREIGDPNLPTTGLGASSTHIAIANGSNVYCLDAKLGKVLWSQPCRGAVSSSPAVNDEYVFVPLYDGHVEIFNLKSKGVGSKRFVGYGRATTRPLVTEETISWPTRKGFYNVAFHATIGGIKYRLRSDGAIVAPGTSLGNQLYVASTDGFVYSINEFAGNIAWQFSTGEKIVQSPVPVEGYLYVITNENEMFKLDLESGLEAEGWEKPLRGIRDYVGAGKDSLYVIDVQGNLQAISQESGKRLGATPAGNANKFIRNFQTDRLYIGNENGLLQCVREAASIQPYFHSGEIVKVKKPKSAKVAGDDPDAGDSDDPFSAGGDDPFGGGGDDPFGAGGDDPFAMEESGDAGADPFAADGGGADPFAADGGGADPFAADGGDDPPMEEETPAEDPPMEEEGGAKSPPDDPFGK